MSETASSSVRDALRGAAAEQPMPEVSNPSHSTNPVEASDASESSHLPKDLKLERSKIAPGLYKPVPEMMIFEWQAPSRPFKKRNRQFFVTISIIALLVSLILFFSGQFLPIAVVISVVFLMYVLQVIPPHQIKHTITTFGINVEGNLYYWEELGRFWFDKKYDQLTLNIETARFPGRVSLLFPEENRKEISEILSEVLLQQKPDLTLFEKLGKWIQDKIPLE